MSPNKKKNRKKKKKRKFNLKEILIDIILSYEVLISSLGEFQEINIKKKEDIYKFAYFGYLLRNEIPLNDEGRKKLADAVLQNYEDMEEELSAVSKHPVWRYAFCYLVTGDLLGKLNEKKVNMVLKSIEWDILGFESISDAFDVNYNGSILDKVINEVVSKK